MLRKYIEKCGEGIEPYIKRFNIKDPALMTFLSVAFSFLGAVFAYKGLFIIAFILFLLSLFFDTIDSVVARVNKSETQLRVYYDSMTDRINEFMMIFPLAFRGFSFESFLALSISYLTSYSRARAWHSKNDKGWPSFGERHDRLIMLLLLYLLASLTTGIFQLYVIKIMLYLLAFVAIIGLIRRTFYAISNIGN